MITNIYIFGWFAGVFSLASDNSYNSDRCNIRRMPMPHQFALPEYPVIFEASHDRNKYLSQMSNKSHLAQKHGTTDVVLSSSNTYSYEKITMSLGNYIDYMMNPNSNLANETFYMFGNNYEGIWKEMSKSYVLPDCSVCAIAGAVTLGLGGTLSGVSFHMHGPGFSEVIHGRKRWFLFPPGFQVHYNPNVSQRKWVDIVYPTLFNDNSTCKSNDLQECVIGPGEILYFPDRWLHATLNLDEFNFFVSLFIDINLAKKSN